MDLKVNVRRWNKNLYVSHMQNSIQYRNFLLKINNRYCHLKNTHDIVRMIKILVKRYLCDE